jgi:hypothetical protein
VVRVRWLFALAALMLAAAALWAAGEMHYRNCITAAGPAPTLADAPSLSDEIDAASGIDDLMAGMDGREPVTETQPAADPAGCSRLPF